MTQIAYSHSKFLTLLSILDINLKNLKKTITPALKYKQTRKDLEIADNKISPSNPQSQPEDPQASWISHLFSCEYFYR